MTFHPTMQRRLHERLHPLIGEEEADALLDEISPPDPVTREWLRTELDDRFERAEGRFVTKEWAEERFVTKEHLDLRFDALDRRFEALDPRFDALDVRFEALENRLMAAISSLEVRLTEKIQQQTQLMVGSSVFIATVLSIAQIIWG